MGLLFGKGDPAAPPRFELKDLLTSADKTRSGSNVQRVPLDVLVRKATSGTNRVAAAEAQLIKCERALEQTRQELETILNDTVTKLTGELEGAQRDLTEAQAVRLKAQEELQHRLIDEGAFEGVRDFNALAKRAPAEA